MGRESAKTLTMADVEGTNVGFSVAHSATSLDSNCSTIVMILMLIDYASRIEFR